MPVNSAYTMIPHCCVVDDPCMWLIHIFGKAVSQDSCTLTVLLLLTDIGIIVSIRAEKYFVDLHLLLVFINLRVSVHAGEEGLERRKNATRGEVHVGYC